MRIEKINVDKKNISLAVWKIEEDIDALLSSLERPEFFLSDFEKITSVSRKREFLATRVLLKKMMGKELRILHHASGKPYLENCSHKISISHSKDYVAILLHLTCEAGVDIEHISPRVLRIKHKFLSENELKNLSKTDEATHALVYWSAKESIFKALGKEGVDFAQHLQIKPFKLQKEGILFAKETTQNIDMKLNYRILTDAVITWIII